MSMDGKTSEPVGKYADIFIHNNDVLAPREMHTFKT